MAAMVVLNISNTFTKRRCWYDAKWPPTVGFFPTAPDPRSFPTFVDDGFNTPTARRARSRSPNTRRFHPNLEHCKRHLRHSASSSCLWIRWRSPDNDPGAFPPAPWKQISDSRVSRTRWQTTRTTSTLAGLAVTCAGYSIGD